MENMKHAKKLLGLLLALAMVLSLAATAFATGDGIDAAQTENVGDKTEGSTPGTTTGGSVGGKVQQGKITIDNAVKGQEYKIYKILDLTVNKANGSYSYKATADWEAWLKTQTKYVKVDDQGYVTWGEDTSDANVAAFAKAARQQIADADISATGRDTAGSETLVFENLALGYYLLDSAVGTLCSLNSTAYEVTIQDKNTAPTVDKKVLEESYDKVNDAGIGDTVYFRATITVGKGARNYIFRDKMSSGLTFDGPTSIKVYLNPTIVNDEITGDPIASGNYVINGNHQEGEKDITFDVSFNQNFCDTLKEGDQIVIAYSATVNGNAVIGGNGNDNDCQVTYGDNNSLETEWSKTKTYVWSFDILKYANGDKTKRLADARFVLLNEDKNKVATIANGKLTEWVNVPTAGADGKITWPDNSIITTNATANIVISGLDGGTYYLREVEAPAGYNLLAEDQAVNITPTTNGTNNTMALAPVTAEVNNQSGTELPSTGGIGTTIFYVLGSALLIGAVVLLVARKRMNAEK